MIDRHQTRVRIPLHIQHPQRARTTAVLDVQIPDRHSDPAAVQHHLVVDRTTPADPAPGIQKHPTAAGRPPGAPAANPRPARRCERPPATGSTSSARSSRSICSTRANAACNSAPAPTPARPEPMRAHRDADHAARPGPRHSAPRCSGATHRSGPPARDRPPHRTALGCGHRPVPRHAPAQTESAAEQAHQRGPAAVGQGAATRALPPQRCSSTAGSWTPRRWRFDRLGPQYATPE